MTDRAQTVLDESLTTYLSSLLCGLGRVERCQALCHYAAGLLLYGERKSMGPIAARLAQHPGEVDAIRQRMQQAVVVARWDEDLLRKRMCLHLQKELGDLEALIGDDTGLPKYGPHSVGTARQYSGTLGRVAQCQVVTSLHAAGPSGSFCAGAQLYLPQSWCDDPVRLAKAGVPEHIEFATKWQILLSLYDRLMSWGFEKLPFVGDAGYGDVSEFRRELNARQVPYVLEVMYTTSVWAPGTGPAAPGQRTGRRGPVPTQYRDANGAPGMAAELALSQTQGALQTVSWKNGDGELKQSRFGRVRIKPATGHCKGQGPEPEQWLFWQWPEAKSEPEHYWLSTLPEQTPLERLVYLAKLRWRVERDYQEQKAEVGLDHFEGRSWNGLHHHLSLCALSHGFLVQSRARLMRAQATSRPREPSGGASALKKTLGTEEPATKNVIAQGAQGAQGAQAPPAALDAG